MSATASPPSATGPLTANGAEEIARYVVEHGQRHVFGVTGSNATSMFRALDGQPVEFVHAVHEAVAVAMADGYARVTGEGTVMLYMMPGTANGLTNVYNAWHDETPLMVLISDQDSRVRNGTVSIGEADLPGTFAPYANLAATVPAGAPLREWLERAQRAALGPATGPAVLSLPRDVLELPATPSSHPSPARRVPVAPADVSVVAERLRTAQRPLIVVGGQVLRSGGATVLAELAARHAIPVALSPGFNDRLSIAPWHSSFVGSIGVGSAADRLAADADVAIVAGARFFSTAHPEPGERFFPEAGFVAHVDADQRRLEEGQLADWASPASPAEFFTAVAGALSSAPPSEGVLAARRRRLDEATSRPETHAGPLDRAGHALHDALERGWVVDESTMSSLSVIEHLSGGVLERYLMTSGAALGWGPSAACGVALASGDPVTCVVGDGTLLFGMHGLWTAKAYDLPVTYVVIDNQGYGSTGHFEREYLKSRGDGLPPAYIGSDLSGFDRPVADVFDGFRIPYRTVDAEGDVRGAIAAAWDEAADGPNAVVVDIGSMAI